jgi:hypothetical protein
MNQYSEWCGKKKKMSRSVKKKSFTGYTTSESEKQDKQHANRKYRRKIKVLLPSTTEDTIFPEVRETSNVYTFDKDGKQYLHEEDCRKKYMKK